MGRGWPEKSEKLFLIHIKNIEISDKRHTPKVRSLAHRSFDSKPLNLKLLRKKVGAFYLPQKLTVQFHYQKRFSADQLCCEPDDFRSSPQQFPVGTINTQTTKMPLEHIKIKQ